MLSGEAYQFLQNSQLPTYHFQKSLPRLPIPALTLSCKRLLAAAKPILPPERYISLEQKVKKFQNDEGPDLHKALVEYDRNHKDNSYISEAWFDIYLRDRSPCPINFNPFMTFAEDPTISNDNQLAKCTNFIISFGRMKRSLDANILEPEIFHMNPKRSDTKFLRMLCRALPTSLSWYGAAAFKAYPLDMSQYPSLFGGSRIPQIGKDKLHHCSDSKHFIVIHKGNFYSVNLFDQNGNLVPPAQIHACIANILSNSQSVKTDECVGVLTTLNRDHWAEVRSKMTNSAKNLAALSTIDDGLFAICLDDGKAEDINKLMETSLTGNDAANRWFDKCFQLIVDGEGTATINFEHSWGDGVAVLRLMKESYRDIINNRFVSPNQPVDKTVDLNSCMKRIEFDLSDEVRRDIKKARELYINVASKLSYGTAIYDGLNRTLIKKSGLSPDAIMQLAIQLTYYILYGEFVPTYESCSTAAFLKGRTECVRSVTSCTRDAILAITESSPNLYEKIQDCSNRHSQLVKEAAMGEGFDRHFLGLRVTAERLGRKMPELFNSEEYTCLHKFILSTSTLSSDTIQLGGFGPTEEGGFGIGYNVNACRMGAAVVTDLRRRNIQEFCTTLMKSLDTINSIIRKEFQ